MKNKLILIMFVVILVFSLSACGSRDNSGGGKETETGLETDAGTKNKAGTETETGTKTLAETTATAETVNCIEDLQPVIYAIEHTSDQGSVGIKTTGVLKLEGNLISGTYHLKSQVHITQDEDHENLLMSSVASSDMDDIVTTSCYKDGWYYLDGEDGKEKEEKSPEEVLSLISGVTDLVKEGAERIESVQVEKEDGGILTYTYELPSYLAQQYLKKLVNSAEVEDLEGASINIDKAVLISRIDGNRMLQTQKVQIEGSIHKLIFTVPAEVAITAKFVVPDTEDPTIKTW